MFDDTAKTWWCFHFSFIFAPTWGNAPILLIFLKWVETTDQKMSLDLKSESWHNSGGATVMILVQKSLLLSTIITPSEYVHLDKRHIW